MNKADNYRQVLKALTDWEPYLLQKSGLPGPRGILELAQAVPMKAIGKCSTIS